MNFVTSPYSMAKSKSLHHLLKSCKHPQTYENNIASSYENSQSISQSLVVKFNTSCHNFSQNYRVLCKNYYKLISFLYLDVPHLTASWLRSAIFHHLNVKLGVKVWLAIFCYYFVLTEIFFASSEGWELVFSH